MYRSRRRQPSLTWTTSGQYHPGDLKKDYTLDQVIHDIDRQLCEATGLGGRLFLRL